MTFKKANLVSLQRLSQQEDDKSQIKQGKDRIHPWVLPMRKLLMMVVNERLKFDWPGKKAAGTEEWHALPILVGGPVQCTQLDFSLLVGGPVHYKMFLRNLSPYLQDGGNSVLP